MSRREPVLILASSSPRRRELLGQLGIAFAVAPADVNEDVRMNEPPLDYVKRLAAEKAQTVAAQHPGKWVLGADTSVVVSGGILGKPRDAEDAARMLRSLSGRDHQVMTGVSLVDPGGNARTCFSTSIVIFRPIAEEEIRQYVAGGEPMDKAGAYAIQGGASRWADRIEGEYSNVVGLPLSLVTEMLRKSGLLK